VAVQGSDSTVSLVLPAEPTSVRAARQVMRRFAEKVGADSDAVAQAVSEAVTNAVQHAYPTGDGDIFVRAAVNHELYVSVADRGIGLAPKAKFDGSHMGLTLIAFFADSLTVVSGDGVRLEMRFARRV
jgi:serine/threonine-protein kinase RsbW